MRRPDAQAVVILAGSGRSGTTWLGSILNSYEHAEYFYEICAYPELDFDDPGLLRAKHPLIFWLPRRPWAIRELERWLLAAAARRGLGTATASRALRLQESHCFRKQSIDVALFKIVKLYDFALNADALTSRLGKRLNVVHIIRNPYSQLMSEMRIDARNPEASRRHFSQRIEAIIENPRLQPYHALARRYLKGSWIEQMALVWWVSNEMLLRRNGVRTHLVVYESLCRDPHGEVARIFDFLGWALSKQTRAYIHRTTNIAVSESGNFSIQKNADESMTRWRQEISAPEYEQVNRLLADCALMKLWPDGDLQLHAA